MIAAHEGGILTVGIVLYGTVSEPLHLLQTTVENSLQAQSREVLVLRVAHAALHFDMAVGRDAIGCLHGHLGACVVSG